MKRVKTFALVFAVLFTCCFAVGATNEEDADLTDADVNVVEVTEAAEAVEVIDFAEEAAEAAEGSIVPFASTLIDSSSATISAGSSKKIVIGFSVGALVSSSEISSLGAASIVIYKSDGTYMTTIWGSTANGLMTTGAKAHAGTYTYTGTSGTSYYAIVQLFVTAKSGSSESRERTTSTATAP